MEEKSDAVQMWSTPSLTPNVTDRGLPCKTGVTLQFSL